MTEYGRDGPDVQRRLPMWQEIAPSHNSLNDAMKSAELRERGHMNASPNRRILAFKNDEQLREIGKISHLHYSTRLKEASAALQP